MQVSFEPQQVEVVVRRDQHTHELTEQGGVFSLNFLDTEQEDLARRFTEPLQPGDDTVGDSAYTTGESRAPLFEEAFAYLECRVVGKMEAGDHTVYLGEVAANLRRPADILTDLDTPMECGADRPRLESPRRGRQTPVRNAAIRARQRGRWHRG